MGNLSKDEIEKILPNLMMWPKIVKNNSLYIICRNFEEYADDPEGTILSLKVKISFENFPHVFLVQWLRLFEYELSQSKRINFRYKLPMTQLNTYSSKNPLYITIFGKRDKLSEYHNALVTPYFNAHKQFVKDYLDTQKKIAVAKLSSAQKEELGRNLLKDIKL